MKLDNPLISVIIPVYKVEKYLKRCVDSVINQSYKNLEIILVDDGSPDKCGDICDEYEKNDSRVVVIHKKNGGLSDARNFGLDIAKGEYIMFVDSDDWIHREMIDRLYSALENDGSRVSIADFLEVDENFDECEFELEGRCFSYSKKSFLNDFYWKNSTMCVIACAKLFQKDLFDSVRFPVGKIHEDAYTIPMLYLKIEKISIVMEKMYFYFQREDSIMHSARYAHREENYKALMYYLDFYLEKGYNEFYVKGIPLLLEQLYKEYAFFLNVSNDKGQAEKYSRLVRKYLKLSKKLGKKFYSLPISTKPHIYEAAYPTFMKYYWILCSLKNKIFKK